MTITEVSKKFSIASDTLRYYERIGLLPMIGWNVSRYREYPEEDCEWIYFIIAM